MGAEWVSVNWLSWNQTVFCYHPAISVLVEVAVGSSLVYYRDCDYVDRFYVCSDDRESDQESLDDPYWVVHADEAVEVWGVKEALEVMKLAETMLMQDFDVVQEVIQMTGFAML